MVRVLGSYPRARELLRAAVRSSEMPAIRRRNRLRLALAYVPPLGNVVWRSRAFKVEDTPSHNQRQRCCDLRRCWAGHWWLAGRWGSKGAVKPIHLVGGGWYRGTRCRTRVPTTGRIPSTTSMVTTARVGRTLYEISSRRTGAARGRRGCCLLSTCRCTRCATPQALRSNQPRAPDLETVIDTRLRAPVLHKRL